LDIGTLEIEHCEFPENRRAWQGVDIYTDLSMRIETTSIIKGEDNPEVKFLYFAY
jgi:hypothetical protein